MDFLQFLPGGMHAYGGAADALAVDVAASSVGVWALLIAAGVVLLEWLAARLRGRHRSPT